VKEDPKPEEIYKYYKEIGFSAISMSRKAQTKLMEKQMGIKKSKKEIKNNDHCFAITAGLNAGEQELMAADR